MGHRRRWPHPRSSDAAVERRAIRPGVSGAFAFLDLDVPLANAPRRAPGDDGPLRVAVFSYRLPVPGKQRGGVDRVAHDLADGLGRRGHEVTVWSYDEPIEGARYRVRPLPWAGFFDSWLGMRLTLGGVGNVVALRPDYGAADVVIAVGDSLLLPLRGIPVLRVMMGSALGEALSASSPWRFVMQLGVYAQELATGATQLCVGISHNTRRFNPLVRRVIPIGVDTDVFRPDPGARTPHPSLLFVGTLSGRKRGALLLEAFRREIRPAVPGASLIIVGPPGPPEDGVEYRTGISMSDLAALYRSAWLYATPSRYEGFGLPYVEAMASGTPVVATPNPGSREVLDDGRYGVLAGDGEFGAKLIELLRDERARAELAARGLERSKDYAMQTVLDAYEALLRQLARGRARS